ncbi:MAG: sialidase family protein [Salibacteraceae bacterium]
MMLVRNAPLCLMTLVLLLQTDLAFAQQNVLIYEQEHGKFAPCEPSIAINPNNTEKMVVGTVLDYVSYSKDGGKTWKTERLQSSLGVYGDPCIVADDRHGFYYFHLSNPSGEGWANDDILDRIVCQRKARWRNAWNDGVGIGFNPPKDQDKEWAYWDPVKKRLLLTYTQFDRYGSEEEGCETNIFFSSSKNGKKWIDPIKINTLSGNCEDESETAEGAVPSSDIDGNPIVSWGLNGKIYFQRLINDVNGGLNPETVVVENDAHWAFSIPGIGRANGMPITLCDHSNANTRGTIYINWADQRNGENDTDIWLVKSTDNGKTWSAPKRINDDPPGKHQFFTWMAIDQTTGFLYAVFYDRRNHEGLKTDVYLAVSKDGGEHFINTKISDSPFTPSDDVFFGDYNNIAAHNGVIRPVWTRNDQGKLSIWIAIIE